MSKGLANLFSRFILEKKNAAKKNCNARNNPSELIFGSDRIGPLHLYSFPFVFIVALNAIRVQRDTVSNCGVIDLLIILRARVLALSRKINRTLRIRNDCLMIPLFARKVCAWNYALIEWAGEGAIDRVRVSILQIFDIKAYRRKVKWPNGRSGK